MQKFALRTMLFVISAAGVAAMAVTRAEKPIDRADGIR